MDYHEYKANCVQAFVAAILSTGGPVTETLIEAAWYKVVVHQAFKIADYIIEEYSIPVHLCGGTEERPCAERLCALVRHPEAVVSHVGSLSFQEWASVIQYADFVVGNDSATIHLAAAARRPSVGITGRYDGNQVSPYLIDTADSVESLPVYVQSDVLCEACHDKGYFFGYANPACIDNVKKGNCVSCIEAVAVNEVKDAVDSIRRGRVFASI